MKDKKERCRELNKLFAKLGGGSKECTWARAFDGHFNIACNSDERANGNFKGKEFGAKWEFIYCPYCAGEIFLTEE